MSQRPVQNIGVADAYLRLVGGLSLLALGAGRKLGRVGSVLAIVLGASKVAEGITRYCPVYDLFDLTSVGGGVRRLERSGGAGAAAHAPAAGAEPVAGETRTPVPRTFPWEESPARTTEGRPASRSWRPRSAIIRSSSPQGEKTSNPD